MTDEELKQLVASNARAIQALTDAMVEDRFAQQEFRDRITRLEDVVERLTQVQEGVTNLLASLDDDRPTIFRRLMSIESKVDQLLERQENPEES